MQDRIEGVGPGRLGSEASHALRKRNFERLSERRLEDAKRAITRLSGLSSPYNYRYSRAEANQIVNELNEALIALTRAFESGLEDLDRLAARRRMVVRRLKRKQPR